MRQRQARCQNRPHSAAAAAAANGGSGSPRHDAQAGEPRCCVGPCAAAPGSGWSFSLSPPAVAAAGAGGLPGVSSAMASDQSARCCSIT